MNLLSPPSLPKLQTGKEDQRLAHFIQSGSLPESEPKAVLIGYPSSEGAKRNGGRGGAEEGPKRIREQLYRLTPDSRDFDRHVALLKDTFDLGDLAVESDVKRNQEKLAEGLSPYVEKDIPVIVLGGSHDVSLAGFWSFAHADKSVSVLNLDSHADVRDGSHHSGSPFREALEHDSTVLKHYSIFGLAPWSTSFANLNYLKQKGCEVLWQDELSEKNIEKYLT